MVNLRFHLVSIVGIFLALALGISLGSGFFGAPIIEDLRERIDSVSDRNSDLRARVDELTRRVNDDERFASAAKAWLTEEALADRSIIVLSFDQGGESLLDNAIASVEEANGEVTASMTFSEKLMVESGFGSDELELILASGSDEVGDASVRAASLLGKRLAAVATGGGKEARQRLQDLVEGLQQAGYVNLEQQSEVLAPPNTTFLLVAQGASAPLGDVAGFAITLADHLSQTEGAVVAAGTSESEWAVIEAIRADDGISSAVSTIDHADTVQGQIALVLALEQAIHGTVGHYGFEEGVAGPIPVPAPTTPS